MSHPEPSIRVNVDVTNPGQFFACCGLLELADRLWPGAEGWFDGNCFHITGSSECSLGSLLDNLAASTVANTMTPTQNARLEALAGMTKKQREATPGLDDEKKLLESLRRELPIVFAGAIVFLIDWFCDEFGGGSRFKTWAGQQSVLDIARAMHSEVTCMAQNADPSLWRNARDIDLPFNFDSDLGGQGSGIDIGFVFDALAGSETTRIKGTCRPALELLCFVGLQRFRPREIPRQNRFVFNTWHCPLPPSVASAVVCGAVSVGEESLHEFKLLYRTKYLKSFLPCILFQGDRDE
ncbi:MAG: type I-U CRISPR-associated protein Cas8c [Phycisphaeraceae bacterium]|nr:type I-U CRISPR-associated protein Cas8c [Phycisphaeraceae bacterium]